ncbi:MAG: hypothetical protein M1383_03280 [Patescibacteria group bacterium]|nr:hypothetical protein [Patescibacteria group bacterium]
MRKVCNGSTAVDPFLAKVWLSGGYLKLAVLLKNDEREEAEKFLELAKGIIASDKRLVLRRKQLAALRNTDRRRRRPSGTSPLKLN